jgi:hypothetical protein
MKWSRDTLDDAVTAVCGLVNAKGEFQLWKIVDGKRDAAVEDVKTKIALKEAGDHEGPSEADFGANGKDDSDKVCGEGKVSAECLGVAEIGECIGLSLDWAAPCERLVPLCLVLCVCVCEHFVFHVEPYPHLIRFGKSECDTVILEYKLTLVHQEKKQKQLTTS